MVFNDKVLFIHVPKTGGIAVTRFLIDNTRGDVTISVPPGHPSAGPKVKEIVGTRHERLHEAAALLATLGRKLEDFETIVSIVRNPYDLEVSYFHQKQKSKPWERGRAKDLAMAGDFLEFARRAPFNSRLPVHIEDWYEIDGVAPGNLRVLRFENIEQELYAAVGPTIPVSRKLQKLNVSNRPPYSEFLSPAVEEAIYRKYQWVFDRGFYLREFTARSPA
jgi:hypothetical protein